MSRAPSALKNSPGAGAVIAMTCVGGFRVSGSAVCRVWVARGMEIFQKAELVDSLRRGRKFCYFIIITILMLFKHDLFHRHGAEGLRAGALARVAASPADVSDRRVHSCFCGIIIMNIMNLRKFFIAH